MNKYALLLLAMAVTVIPAKADVTYSIVQVTGTLNPGDTGDLFDVIMTVSNGTTPFSANSFSFEVSTTDTDITFVDATTATTAATYLFAGNSFADTFLGGDIASPVVLPQTLDASDLTGDFSNMTINPGTYGLGHVSFNIANNATPGPFTVTFGNAAANVLADSAIPPNTVSPALTPQQFTIQTPPMPEPSTLLPLSALMLAVGAVLRRRSRR